MPISDIVNVSISTSGAEPTREGFGVPMVVGYHTRWTDRSRRYSSLNALAADGFRVEDAIYQIVRELFSQNPRPPYVKVGRRASAFTQVIDLTPAAPASGTVYAATIDGHLCSYTATNTDTLSAVCTAFASAINTANPANASAIIATGGSTTGNQTLTGTSLNGVIGTAVMSPARALEFVFSSHADWDATTATVTGTDEGGVTISETFAIPNGGSATVTGSKLFRTVTEVDIPAQSGTGGTFTLGTRARVTAVASGGTKVVCTATIAGTLVPYTSPTATLSIFDETSDPGISTDLDAIRAADTDWYGLLIDSNSKAEVLQAAAWAEAQEVLFVAQSGDTACTSSGSTTDVMATLKTNSYARTACFYDDSIASNWLAAGMLGEALTNDPGSDTWEYKTLGGAAAIVPTDSQGGVVVSETQLQNVLDKNGMVYVTIAGVNVTRGGKTASGEWADVTRFVDWLRARLREDVFFLLTANKKIPFTDSGIALVTAAVRGRLNDGVRVGGIATDPPFTITAPKAADVSAADRANRHLSNVAFTARLAGAISTIDITGSVTE